MEIRLTGHGVEQFATPLVTGRRMLPSDVDHVAELHCDATVMSTYGGVRSQTTTEPFIRSNVAHWRRYKFGLYVLSAADEPDEPIGWAGLRWAREDVDDPAVDYSIVLTTAAWGRGYATETTRAIISIGRSLELPLVTEHETTHDSARRVAEKVGFVFHCHSSRHGQACLRYRWPAEIENTESAPNKSSEP